MAINELHQNEWVTIGHCTITIINVLHSHENKFQQHATLGIMMLADVNSW